MSNLTTQGNTLNDLLNATTTITTDNTAGDLFQNATSGTFTVPYDPMHRHNLTTPWHSNGFSTYPAEMHDYREDFGKVITNLLGSNLPQETKDEIINNCIRLKTFRNYIKEYFPQYEDKITLWEKMHPEK